MRSRNAPRSLPGNSILGGAAAGLSYEGALRDALANEEQERRHEAGRMRAAAATVPRPARATRPRREPSSARVLSPH